MTDYVAAFHTHFAALKTLHALTDAGVLARLAPVPRKLSASCGTAVLYAAESPRLDLMDADTELVARVTGGGEYDILMENR